MIFDIDISGSRPAGLTPAGALSTISPMPANPLSPLKAISSMATRAILADLCATYAAQSGQAVEVTSVGGVDAAKRVQAGEPFDLILLASDAIDKLLASGHALVNSRGDWVDSPIAVAVPASAAVPDLRDEAAVRAAVSAAPTLSYSTGPSGQYLEKRFAQWGLLETLRPRIVVPPPGTPVGQLVASGQVALGFQQRSELISVPGLTVVGDLPADMAYITTFSSALGNALASDPERQAAARAFQQFLSHPQTRETKRQHGMDWSASH